MKEEIEVLKSIKNIFLNLKYHGYINDIKKDISTDGVIIAIDNFLKERQQDKGKIKELEESNQEKAKMLTEQNRNLQISYDSLQELFELRKYKNSSIPVSLVEEKIEELIKEGRHYNANKIEVLQKLLERRK